MYIFAGWIIAFAVTWKAGKMNHSILLELWLVLEPMSQKPELLEATLSVICMTLTTLRPSELHRSSIRLYFLTTWTILVISHKHFWQFSIAAHIHCLGDVEFPFQVSSQNSQPLPAWWRSTFRELSTRKNTFSFTPQGTRGMRPSGFSRHVVAASMLRNSPPGTVYAPSRVCQDRFSGDSQISLVTSMNLENEASQHAHFMGSGSRRDRGIVKAILCLLTCLGRHRRWRHTDHRMISNSF